MTVGRVPSAGRPNGTMRRVRDVVADCIAARTDSALASIAIRTVRGYRSVLDSHVNRKRADIGRVLGAALAWEVCEGRLGVNVATHVRIESSKAQRAAMQTVDPVLLPSWGEFATLVEAPEDEHDRLLIALLGWCGLRWSEGVSLHEQAVWRDWPQITIDRVLVRRTQLEVDADTGGSAAVPPADHLARILPQHRRARQHQLPPRRVAPRARCRSGPTTGLGGSCRSIRGRAFPSAWTRRGRRGCRRSQRHPAAGHGPGATSPTSTPIGG